MLALIAGEGRLPGLLLERLRGREVLVCALEGFPPDLPSERPVLRFRLEELGSLLQRLRAEGVTEVCMAGRVQRPEIRPEAVDAATAPLLRRLSEALRQGDDGTLRAIVALFEDHGLRVVGVPEIAPDLLPEAGVPTRAAPQEVHHEDAEVGEAEVAEMGRTDSGQACVIRHGAVVLREGPEGTDAMLDSLATGGETREHMVSPLEAAAEALEGLWRLVGTRGGILFKAPKPGQDRRVDLPTIGPATVLAAARAGLSGIVVEAGGVIVLDREELVRLCDRLELFLWVRPHGGER